MCVCVCVCVSEQQELAKQIQSCGSDRLRQDLEREMETLVKRMENKGEQIAKVRRHLIQVTPAHNATEDTCNTVKAAHGINTVSATKAAFF